MSTRRRQIKELIVNRMNLKMDPAEISDDAPIFGSSVGSLGLDSIDALDLVVAIYEHFNIEIQESDMHIFASVQAIDDFIAAKQGVVNEVP